MAEGHFDPAADLNLIGQFGWDRIIELLAQGQVEGDARDRHDTLSVSNVVDAIVRPHPGPLPQGEGERSAAYLQTTIRFSES